LKKCDFSLASFEFTTACVQVKEQEEIRALNSAFDKLRDDGHKIENFRVPLVDCACFPMSSGI